VTSFIEYKEELEKQLREKKRQLNEDAKRHETQVRYVASLAPRSPSPRTPQPASRDHLAGRLFRQRAMRCSAAPARFPRNVR